MINYCVNCSSTCGKYVQWSTPMQSMASWAKARVSVSRLIECTNHQIRKKNVIVQVCEDSLMIASNTLALDHLQKAWRTSWTSGTYRHVFASNLHYPEESIIFSVTAHIPHDIRKPNSELLTSITCKQIRPYPATCSSLKNTAKLFLDMHHQLYKLYSQWK